MLDDHRISLLAFEMFFDGLIFDQIWYILTKFLCFGVNGVRYFQFEVDVVNIVAGSVFNLVDSLWNGRVR